MLTLNPKFFRARRLAGPLLVVGLTVGGLLGLAAPASAATSCAADVCVVIPDQVQTPVGLVTATVSATGVVTVRVTPTAPNTLVIGVPFTIPAGALVSSCPGGCARTTLDTTGGLVVIDTYLSPPVSPGRFTLPSVAVISIVSPGRPYRVQTVGTTLTFSSEPTEGGGRPAEH